MKIGNYEAALALVNQAIAHTPTVVELYSHKAKIFQRAGNRGQALALTEEARKLDLADRHLNAQSAKYLFKVDQVEQAHETMGMFSKETESG